MFSSLCFRTRWTNPPGISKCGDGDDESGDDESGGLCGGLWAGDMFGWVIEIGEEVEGEWECVGGDMVSELCFSSSSFFFLLVAFLQFVFDKLIDIEILL